MSDSISRRDLLKGMALLPLLPMAARLDSLVSTPAGQPQRPSERMAGDPPNVLVVVFDTLSAPHMSLHGYGRATTPHLERFAQRATVYHRHYAGGNFTTPGTASLLTGTYPWTHRAFNHAGTVADRFRQQNLFSAFSSEIYTKIAHSHNLLADALLQQFGQGIDQHIHPSRYCLAAGEFADRLFANDAEMAVRSVEELTLQRSGPPGSLFLSLADQVRLRMTTRAVAQAHAEAFPRGVPGLFKLYFRLEDAIDGIRQTLEQAPQPFLTYFHLLPPHEPYRPRREFIGRFADGLKPVIKQARFFSENVPQEQLNELRRDYDEFLTYADAEFGRLLDYLERSGRLDDTIVVFTSDHGQLFERGIHGHVTKTLYDPVVHVPLLISVPGQPRHQDIFQPTSCVDVLPTLLHLTGQPAVPWSEGQVLPGLGDATSAGDRIVFAVEATSNRKWLPLTQATFSVVQDQYKLTHYRGYQNHEDEYELFDLKTDPEETTDLSKSRRSIVDELKQELEAQLSLASQRQ